MWGLSNQVMEYAESLPEATPLCAGTLLHLANRAAVDQTLSRLARAGHLMRICRGVYMRPIETRFGTCAPSVGEAIKALAEMWGETIVMSGGSAANRLGLTDQNPIQMVYLTSGPNRLLHFGKETVKLRHAPRWKLAAPNRKAGEVIRALAWLGPEEVEDGLDVVVPQLSADELEELSVARAVMPNWMAQAVSKQFSYG